MVAKAFEISNIFPDEVLGRKKETFSDGICGEKSSLLVVRKFRSVKILAPRDEPTLETAYQRLLASMEDNKVTGN